MNTIHTPSLFVAAIFMAFKLNAFVETDAVRAKSYLEFSQDFVSFNQIIHPVYMDLYIWTTYGMLNKEIGFQVRVSVRWQADREAFSQIHILFSVLPLYCHMPCAFGQPMLL